MSIDSSNGIRPHNMDDLIPPQDQRAPKPMNRPDDVQPAAEQPSPTKPLGETKAVQKLRAQMAEKEIIRDELQSSTAWTEADSPKVIQERAKSAEAQKLHKQLRDPARKALSTARWRKSLSVAVGFGLVAALGWSTANVQQTVAAGAAAWDARWILAFLVEPFISLFLLTIFSFKAFMATHGELVDDPRITRAERTFLGFTLALNVWPHVPLLKELNGLLHAGVAVIGPISAVLAVSTIPVMWTYLGDLDHGGPVADPELVTHLETVRHLIALGEMPENPSRFVMARVMRARDIKINDRMAQRVHRCLTGRTELL